MNLTFGLYCDVMEGQTSQNFPLSTSGVREICLDGAGYVFVAGFGVFFLFSHGYDVMVEQGEKDILQGFVNVKVESVCGTCRCLGGP